MWTLLSGSIPKHSYHTLTLIIILISAVAHAVLLPGILLFSFITWQTLTFQNHLLLMSFLTLAKLFLPCSTLPRYANDASTIIFITLYFNNVWGLIINSLGRGLPLYLIYTRIFQVKGLLINVAWMNEWSILIFPHPTVLCNQIKYFYCKCFYYNMTYAFLKNSIFCKSKTEQI